MRVRFHLPFVVAFAVTSMVALEAPADDASRAEAVQLYGQARDLLAKKKAAEALPLLQKSLALLPSPNTELLIAHASRELGRKARAVEFYRRARSSAEAEVAKGQKKYTDTVSDAKQSEEALLSSVATLDVKLPAGTQAVVHRGEGDDVVLESSSLVLVDPGNVRITVSRPSGSEDRNVEVQAGATAVVEFEAVVVSTGGPPPNKTATPVEPSSSTFGALTIAGGVVGGVGLIGVGLFAGFGLSAKSAYDDLTDCGTECPELNEVTAEQLREDGKRDQLIANVSLGIGLGLAAAGVTLIIVDAVTGPEGKPTEGALQPVLAVFPGGFYGGVIGRFQ
jgi:tetratricopeptide (TPR) repeat protein